MRFISNSANVFRIICCPYLFCTNAEYTNHIVLRLPIYLSHIFIFFFFSRFRLCVGKVLIAVAETAPHTAYILFNWLKHWRDRVYRIHFLLFSFHICCEYFCNILKNSIRRRLNSGKRKNGKKTAFESGKTKKWKKKNEAAKNFGNMRVPDGCGWVRPLRIVFFW